MTNTTLKKKPSKAAYLGKCALTAIIALPLVGLMSTIASGQASQLAFADEERRMPKVYVTKKYEELIIKQSNNSNRSRQAITDTELPDLDFGGGGVPNTTLCHSWDAFDLFADDVRDVFEQFDNFEDVEHGAVINLINGELIVHAIPQGVPTETGWVTDLPEPDYYSQIVSIIHNHPASSESNQIGNLATRYPSLDDWQTADLVVRGDPEKKEKGKADGTQLSLYLIGPDGEMREFKYSDRDKYMDGDEKRMSEFTEASGADLPPIMDHEDLAGPNACQT